jgi:hypothetical protein
VALPVKYDINSTTAETKPWAGLGYGEAARNEVSGGADDVCYITSRGLAACG